jgi:cyclophilin family peptidyl-prolyl cis-trans isomerase
MRYFLLLAAALLVAGCGTSAASSPTPTPIPTPVVPSAPHFDRPPAMTINKKLRYTAQMVTNRGTFTITLLPKVAPIAVNNFVFLARHHYYDGNLFMRIISTFMIQTGDPTGTGFGNPGYEFKDERVTMKYTLGTVAMANSGPNTNGSQFFIVTGPQALRLPPNYTIFGKVTQGMKVVEKIASTPVTTNPASGETSQPLVKVVLQRVTIHVSK